MVNVSRPHRRQVLIDALSEKRTNRTLALGFVWQLPQVGRAGGTWQFQEEIHGVNYKENRGLIWIYGCFLNG